MTLKPSSILLSNYPHKFQVYEATPIEDTDDNKLQINMGYDTNINNKIVHQIVMSDLISAILAYDKLYITSTNITELLDVFEYDVILKLLQTHILQVVPDNDLLPALFFHDDSWGPDCISLHGDNHDITYIELIEKDLEFYSFGQKKMDTLLLLIEENMRELDNEKAQKIIKKEWLHDFKSAAIDKDNIFYKRYSYDKECPKHGMLRLLELNKNLIISGLLDISSMNTDSSVRELLNLKCSSFIRKPFTDGVHSFQSITKKKEIPDLGKLYQNNAIDLSKILKLRDSFQGKLFRYWTASENFDESEMQKEIMNTCENVLGKYLSNSLRFVGTQVLGVIDPVLGFISSSADSFVIDKILKGWHPNFFLDDKLRVIAEKCNDTACNLKTKALIQARLGEVPSDAPCPCGSGKKFKECHGKNKFR